MPRNDTPLSIEVPAPGADRPPWGKVGIVAGVGFVFGILWPRLTSTRIAPNPPSDAPAAANTQPAPPAGSSAVPLSAAVAPAIPPDPGVAVSQGAIVRCHDGKDDTKEDCGSLEFDPIAVPKIKALAQCPAANGLAGKLSIGFDVDFRKKDVKVQLGKSTTLPRDKAEALIRCADTAFDKVSLGEVPHEHRRYTVFYVASFSAPNKGEPVADKLAVEGPVAGTTTSESPANGTAAVGWDVAIVRDAPKTGTIVGRVLRGSKVKVVAHQGEWYRVQYGSIEGWVYRGTIGL
jgi:Bacterial SH3 domain